MTAQSPISNLKSPSFWLKVLLVVALGLLAAPQLWYPLWFDQGAFAACADILRQGGVMFRDCFDVRGPAVVVAYLIPRLFSSSPVAIHVFDLLCQVVTAVVLGLLAHRMWNRWAGIAAGVLYWLLYASMNYWATAQAEGFANLFFVLALYAAWRGTESTNPHESSPKGERKLETRDQRFTTRAWWIVSGGCVGVLFWFKYPFVLIGLLPVLLIIFSYRKPAKASTPIGDATFPPNAVSTSRNATKPAEASTPTASTLQISNLQSPISNLRSPISFLLGALAILVLGLLYFMLNGAISNLASQISYDVITFNNVSLAYRLEWLRTIFWEEVLAFVSFGNTPTAGFKDTVTQVSIVGRGYPFIFLLMAVGTLVGLARPSQCKATCYALAYFVLTVLISLWQGHFYRYHFVIVLPAMALLAAADFGFSISDFRFRITRSRPGTPTSIPNLQSPVRQSSIVNRQFIIQLLKSVLWLLAAAGLAASMLPWAYDALDNALVQRKPAQTLYLESKLAPYSLVAQALAAETQPQDRIAVFSDVPAINPLAQRLSGTRFPYVRPLQEAADAGLRAELVQQYLDDLTRNQPRFFVLTQADFPWPGADFISLWKSLPAIHQYVEANYHYVGENGPFLIFIRNGS
jgi:hypothetical protein